MDRRSSVLREEHEWSVVTVAVFGPVTAEQPASMVNMHGSPQLRTPPKYVLHEAPFQGALVANPASKNIRRLCRITQCQWSGLRTWLVGDEHCSAKGRSLRQRHLQQRAPASMPSIQLQRSCYAEAAS